MAAATSPNEGMFVLIPVGGGSIHRRHDLLPVVESPPFQTKSTEDFPPGFDPLEIRGILGLRDESPARMMNLEEP